jgi:hypothetical protein
VPYLGCMNTVTDLPNAELPATTGVAGALASSRMIEGLAPADYHAAKDEQSCSMLKEILVSPAHYLQALLRPNRSSDAMDHGTLLHALVLEPHTFNRVAAVFPGDLTKEGKAFKVENADRICISLTEYFRLLEQAEKVRAACFRGRPFERFIEEGKVETSIFYTDPSVGLPCRVRMDLLHPEFTFDLKSTRHGLPSAFQRDALSMHYDLQSFMYSLARCLFEGVEDPKPFVFVQAESAAPHSVIFRPATKGLLANGKLKYEAALGAVKACMMTDVWPAPNGEVELDVEPWDTFRTNTPAWAK